MPSLDVVELSVLDVASTMIIPSKLYMSSDFPQFYGRTHGLPDSAMQSVLDSMVNKGWLERREVPRSNPKLQTSLEMTSLGGEVWSSERHLDFDLFFDFGFTFTQINGVTKKITTVRAYSARTCWEAASEHILPLVNKQCKVEHLDFKETTGRLHYWRDPTTFHEFSYCIDEKIISELDDDELAESYSRLKRQGIWTGWPGCEPHR